MENKDYLKEAIEAAQAFIQSSNGKAAATDANKSQRESASRAAFNVAMFAPHEEKKLRELISKDGDLVKAKAAVSIGFTNAEFLQAGNVAKLQETEVSLSNHANVTFTQSSLYKVVLAVKKEAKAVKSLADIEANRIAKAVTIYCADNVISAEQYSKFSPEAKQAAIAYGMDKVMQEEAEQEAVTRQEAALAELDSLKARITDLPAETQLALADWIIGAAQEAKAA